MQDRIKYEQLQPEDRMTIASMQQQGHSVRAMARTLRRAPSTICRELTRNTPADTAYGSQRAHQFCLARAPPLWHDCDAHAGERVKQRFMCAAG